MGDVGIDTEPGARDLDAVEDECRDTQRNQTAFDVFGERRYIVRDDRELGAADPVRGYLVHRRDGIDMIGCQARCVCAAGVRESASTMRPGRVTDLMLDYGGPLVPCDHTVPDRDDQVLGIDVPMRDAQGVNPLPGQRPGDDMNARNRHHLGSDAVRATRRVHPAARFCSRRVPHPNIPTTNHGFIRPDGVVKRTCRPLRTFGVAVRAIGTRRRVAVLVVALSALAPAALFARPAAAFPPGDPVYVFKYNVAATTQIAKLNQTISPPPGIFQGGIDLSSGQLKGSIILPPATFTYQVEGLLPVTATAAIVQVKPVTGHVNIANFKVTATATFNIHILTAYVSTPTLPTLPTLPVIPVTLPSIPLPPVTIPPVNVVGNSCGTATPISVTMSGIAHLGAASKFTGTFTIPDFANCGPATSVLNQLIPGPGNSFSAVATPFSKNPAHPTTTTTAPTLTLPITLPSLPITLPTLPL